MFQDSLVELPQNGFVFPVPVRGHTLILLVLVLAHLLVVLLVCLFTGLREGLGYCSLARRI